MIARSDEGSLGAGECVALRATVPNRRGTGHLENVSHSWPPSMYNVRQFEEFQYSPKSGRWLHPTTTLVAEKIYQLQLIGTHNCTASSIADHERLGLFQMKILRNGAVNSSSFWFSANEERSGRYRVGGAWNVTYVMMCNLSCQPSTSLRPAAISL